MSAGLPGKTSKGAETSRRIKNAALSLFARQGYNGTSMRQIAREAGISVGLAYNYYPGKRDILIAILVEHGQILNQEYRKVWLLQKNNPMTARDTLSYFGRAIKRREKEFRLFWGLLLQPDLVREVQEQLKKIQRQAFQELKTILKTIRPDIPARKVRHIISWVLGNTINYLVFKKYFDPEKSLPEILDYIDAGRD